MEKYNVHLLMKRITVKSISIYFLSTIMVWNVWSCLELNNTYTKVAPGVWRGMLDLRDQATLPPHPEHTDPDTEFDFSKTPAGVLPFNFEVSYPEQDSMQFYLINGEEKIPVSSYDYEENIQGETGRLTLHFPIYETRISAKVEAGVMEGNWIVEYKENYVIPFKAYLGQKFRFTDIAKNPTEDISGRWAMTFSPDTEEEYPAVGEFDQENTTVKGNISTETGDYRYASGNVSGDEFFLSSFNGLQAYLYEGKIINSDSIIGAFYSGNHFRTTWEGNRNAVAFLRSPASITGITTNQPVSWKARSIDGDMIDFDQPPYQDKIKILEIMGSWCPNCHDEAKFLKEWKAANDDLPVEIVSLSFERSGEEEKAFKIIREFRKKLDLDWPVVFGGSTTTANRSELTSFIEDISAYPTLVIFDEKNKVRYVHTGFYGPATSEYNNFKKEFDQMIRGIIP